MVTVKTNYSGNLRTEAEHQRSGQRIITDAPTDNHGRGEAFSPTDLLATSLGSCMLTVMGIAANKNQIQFSGAHVETTKIMASSPRRVEKVIITMNIPDPGYSEKERRLLETAALNCPVAKSLHPDLVQEVSFSYT